ncbi:hypothetical protein OESDEN_00757 [Oesophagostomum dentatum]|uniref:Uncharacterized protein n=1 Tax=Oesophagostomum dentatum TaxID=61180 RepID=A0A0B1TTV0_OESDE|nr:hypothetical protein OESDEN_00757 [Oesophagostomum dentatum]
MLYVILQVIGQKFVYRFVEANITEPVTYNMSLCRAMGNPAPAPPPPVKVDPLPPPAPPTTTLTPTIIKEEPCKQEIEPAVMPVLNSYAPQPELTSLNVSGNTATTSSTPSPTDR